MPVAGRALAIFAKASVQQAAPIRASNEERIDIAISRQAIRWLGRWGEFARLAIAPSAGMIRIRFVGIISDPEHSGTPQHHFKADTMVRQRELVKPGDRA